METINIACACDRHYLPIAAGMLCSLFENNSDSNIQVFLLYKNLRASELHRIIDFAETHLQTIIPIRIENENVAKLKITGELSDAAYYRLYLPDLLPKNIDKILYLDSDIIVRKNILSLWKMPLEKNPVAAVHDPFFSDYERLNISKESGYFNSGVMLINLDLWKEQEIHKLVIDYIEENPEKLIWPDQDGLNVVLRDKWFKLPAIYNATSYHFAHEIDYRDSIQDPTIVHFTGSGKYKPWDPNSKHVFRDEYIHYQMLTPWNKLRSLPYQGMTLRMFLRMIWVNINTESNNPILNKTRVTLQKAGRYLYNFMK
jgi:lipopolysaccharide biosynthesis glycosyltransferase